MNLYLISQNVNVGYDTFDSAVVVAKDENGARKIHPDKDIGWDGSDFYSSWCNSEDVHVELLGLAKDSLKEGQVICSSFNAG